MLVLAWHRVGTGRGRARAVHAVSSGMASPHSLACPLRLVLPVKQGSSSPSWGAHKTPELQRLGLEKLQTPVASLSGLAGSTSSCSLPLFSKSILKQDYTTCPSYRLGILLLKNVFQWPA